MKLQTLFFLLVISGNVLALDAEEIRALAKEPHSREDLLEELKIYPEAREYNVVHTYIATGEKPETHPEIIAKEKTVRGQFIVTEVEFPDLPAPLIMVVTFDKKTDTFKKWALLPNGAVAASTGVADLKERTIAWISNEPFGDPPMVTLAIESHSDERSSWKETTLTGAEVISTATGVATKTK